MTDQVSQLEALEHRLTNANAEPVRLSYALIQSITKDFSKEIGRGGFGVVYKGFLRNGEVAVKKLFIEMDLSQKLFGNEVNCLARAKHNNIARLLGYCWDTQGKLTESGGSYVMADVRERLLCFEYVPNGNLHNYIKGISHGAEWQTRYKIIKGICHGLQYLHKERINHLNLKPENVLLDAYMEPKITDFGLSRRFAEGQSKVITQLVRGTWGYMAPEIRDKQELSFKADIYSLGRVVLNLLAGQNDYDIENLHESLDADCPGAKICIEIARSCIEVDKDKRPTIEVIIEKLNKMENNLDMFKAHMGRKMHELKLGNRVVPFLAESSARTTHTLSLSPTENIKDERPHGTNAQISQETGTSTEHLAMHPLVLRFPFEQDKSIVCALYLTNNTDHLFAFRLVPGSPERYYDKGLYGNIPPKSTYTLFVRMRGWEQPLPQKDEFMIQSSVMSDEELKDIRQGRANINYCNFFADVKEKNVHKVHELTLQAVSGTQRETTNVDIIPMEKFTKIFSMDVHPTKPWIITSHFGSHFCIWNYQTKELVHEQKGLPFLTARFIEREQWIVAGTAGDHEGWIYVYNYDTWEEVKNLKAHNVSITSLAIHPTKTYVLSASYDHDIELWDWKKGRKSAQTFQGHKGSVCQIAFNPNDANIFASVSEDKTIKIWSLDSPRSNLTLTGHTLIVRCLDYFSSGDKQFLITGSDDTTAKIWDLQTNVCVKTLEGHTDRVSTVYSHPMLPKLMTGSFDGTVRLWNSTTFMLEGILNFNLKEVHALRYGITKDFRRVMIGHRDGLAIMEVDREGHFVGAGRMENAIRYV